jgi:hypothetical protein
MLLIDTERLLRILEVKFGLAGEYEGIRSPRVSGQALVNMTVSHKE